MKAPFIRPTLVLQVIGDGVTPSLRFVLHPDQRVVVGRTEASDLVIDTPVISSRHAELYHEDGRWMMYDTKSASGSFIDDRAIGYGGTAPVPFGARLRLGGVYINVSAGPWDEPPTIPVGQERAAALLDRR